MKTEAPRHLTNANVEAWLRDADYTEATRKQYRDSVRYFTDWMRARGYSDPEPEAFREWIDDAAGRINPYTVYGYGAAVRSFFAWLEKQGICSNITAGVKLPRGCPSAQEQSQGYIPTEDEYRRLIDTARVYRDKWNGPRDHAIVRLLGETGIRPVELCEATYGGLTGMPDPKLLIRGKGCREPSHYVDLTAECLDAINAYYAFLHGKYGRVPKADEPLFPSNHLDLHGNFHEMETRSLENVVKKLGQRANLPGPLTPYSLRHFAVTHLVRTGGTLMQAREFLRHRRVETTVAYIDRDRPILQSMSRNRACGKSRKQASGQLSMLEPGESQRRGQSPE